MNRTRRIAVTAAAATSAVAAAGAVLATAAPARPTTPVAVVDTAGADQSAAERNALENAPSLLRSGTATLEQQAAAAALGLVGRSEPEPEDAADSPGEDDSTTATPVPSSPPGTHAPSGATYTDDDSVEDQDEDSPEDQHEDGPEDDAQDD